jgi:acetyl esterase/lipase
LTGAPGASVSAGRVPGGAAPDQLLERRAEAERMAAGRPLAAGIRARAVDADGVRILVLDGREASGNTPALLYLHGGGFRQGSTTTYATFTSHIAARTGMRVHSVEYRLAPEHPYPAGLDDVLTAYQWLLATRREHGEILLAGDSAGAGLAAALLLVLLQAGTALPRAVALMSPWVDTRNIADSWHANAETELVFPAASAAEAAAMYLAGHDPGDPLASPVLGDWRGAPPMFVSASAAEGLRDDAALLAGTARAAGVGVTHKDYPGAAHGWWHDYPNTDASVELVHDVCRFLAAATA